MTEYKINRPAGYSVRGATMDDIPACVEMFNLWAQKELGRLELSEQEVKNEWSSDDFVPEEDTRLVFDPAGKLVAYVEVWTREPNTVHPWIWGRVHPDYYGLGLGTELTQWAEQRSLSVLETLDPELRVTHEIGIDHKVKPALELFENMGYSHIRSYYTMHIKLDAPPPTPSWADGIALQPFVPERDLEAVYRADTEAFSDHYGFIVQPFEVGFPRFVHHFTETENYDPALWFIAWDGDEIAGISLCRPHAYEDPDMGWVASLGVRRKWRRRGIALALLQHSFGEFYKRGVRKIGLGVDASSLTSATRLYEKAGMHIAAQFDKYEKEIRAGKEISVQSIEEN